MTNSKRLFARLSKLLTATILAVGFFIWCPEALRAQAVVLPEKLAAWETDQIPHNASGSPASLTAALTSLEGIENLVINEFPGGAVLGGELLSPEDMRRVVLLSDSMDSVYNLCSFHPEALRISALYIGKILEQNRINGLQLSPLGNALLLTGTPAEEGDVEKVQRICSSLHIPLINGTRSVVADPRMVLFEVSFVEINKDAFRELGISWPASTLLSDPYGMRIGHMKPANALEVTINHQVHIGNARIISKPRLICASGQKASFQAGGEIPIPRADSEGGISVTWKPYGIILEVAPSIDSQGKIHVQIRSEVSMVDHANAIDGIPGILTRRVDTFLSLEAGQTVVLSGLVHSDDAQNIKKIPLLGDIPILGELFKSRSFQKRETELVVFLTPLPAVDGPHNEDEWRPTTTVEWSGIGPGPQ
jgi:pilus assembly protein CpaC